MRGPVVASWISLLALTAVNPMRAAPSAIAPPMIAPPSAAEEETFGQSPLEMIQHKQQLVYMLLTKSSALKRAARSDNVRARRLAAEAPVLYARAGDALKAGNIVEANKLLNEALHALAAVSKLAPNPLQVKAAQRKRYAELLAGVRVFQKTHQVICDRLSPKNGPVPAVTADLDRIHGLMEQAQKFAHSGHYAKGIKRLEEAHETVVSALNKMLASTTLVYDLKFKSAAEEFDYELARYHSYEELIPVAYAELKPAKNVVTLSERYVKESRAMRDNAQRQAAAGNHRAAIKTLQEATTHLRRALRIAGLAVPK